MSIHRAGLLPTLCVLTAAVAFVAGAVMLRPEPAQAAQKKPRQFVFGPVLAQAGASFNYYNPGARPTPPCTVVFRQAITGATIQTTNVPSVAPNTGTNVDAPFDGSEVIVAVVTFNAPTNGTEVPSPFPGTILFNATGGATVVGPAH
jgi:hypothetical protein